MGPRGPRPGGPGPRGPMTKEKAKNSKGTILRLLKYLAKFKFSLILVIVLVCISAAANLGGTYRLRPIINSIGNIGQLSKPLIMPDDRENVTIKLVVDDEVIYEKEHKTSDRTADVSLKCGQGVNVDVYYDGEFLYTDITNTYEDMVPAIIRNIILLLILYFLGALANWGQSYILASVSQNTVKEIRMDMFKKMELLPLKFFDSKTHGELMSRTTNDVETISQTLSMSVAQIFSSIITLVGTLVMMLILSIPLTVVTLIMVPIMLFLTRTIAGYTRRYYGAQQASLGEMNGHIEEIITGEYAVKVFCQEKQAEEKFDALSKGYYKNAVKAQVISGVVAPMMGMFNNLNYAVTAFVGGLFAVIRVFGIFATMDIGSVIAFLNYSNQFSRPVNEMANMFSQLQSALAGAERVFAIMDEPNEYIGDAEKPELGRVKGEVVLDHVDFGYDDSRLILKDICLHAKPGETIALVGPTGAGKTTIVNLLTRFYDIKSGTITIDGIDISEVQKDSLRRRIAIVLQDTHMFSETVRENIRYGKLDASDEDVESAAYLANANEFIERLPEGYDTKLSDDASNISQGQRQLLSIARAMIADPDILILDEATSSVDTRTELKIQEAMKNLMYGRTSFVIAHRLSTIREADRILVLVDGRIVESGNHKELIALDGMYAKLYNGQFDEE